MSEQQAEETSGEAGSVGAGSTVPNSDPLIDTVMASMRETGGEPASLIAPDHEAPKADLPKPDLPKADLSKADAAKADAATPMAAANADTSKSSKPEAASGSEPKAQAPRAPGKLMIMSPGDRAWSEKPWNEKPAEKTLGAEPAAVPRKRRFAAMAAVAVLALVAGAIGGALATTGFAHVADATPAAPNNQALQASIARIDADIATLKAGLDQTSKLSLAQFNKNTDRLDKIEKAQVEPAARLAKLSEAVDKLRAVPAGAAPVAVAAVTPAARETRERVATGSVTAPAGAAGLPMPAAAPKNEPNRLPIVESWTLRDVGHGGALVEGRQGLYEVYAGDPLPGLGRVDGIRKQDGRWVVVTTRGLIVSR